MSISELGETSSRSHGRIMETFFKAAMRSDWEAVKELSKSYPDALCAQETKSGHTAVSIAVLDGQDKVVEELVNLMKGNGLSHALGTEDDGGNTPLHYAAAIGSVGMCKCIAEVDSGLIGRRNHDGETPLYLAVLHCEKRAFLCLHYLICRRGEEQRYTYCRRNDGDTILHCAIDAEYLDFACQITRLYPRLANSVNQQGLSPLHILASKPSAFRSGSQVQGFNKFIYLCIYVHHTFLGRTTIYEGSKYNESVKKFPENYQACFNFAWLLKKLSAFFVFGPGGKRKSNQNQDEEDPNSFLGWALVRELIIRYLEILTLIYVTILSVLILGPSEHVRIQKAKMMNTKCVWILDALFERTSMYKNPSGDNEGHVPIEKSSVDWRLKPLLVAAQNGVTEIVERYLARFPVAVFEVDEEKKNIVLLAVEHRQSQVYQLLLNLKTAKDTLFRQVDRNGNSVMHLAAKLRDKYRTRLNQDAALHMQREIKWFQYVRDSVPVGSSVRLNSERETAEELFCTTHEDMVKVSAEWFVHVLESCSFVAALVATVAFATATTIPGGVKQDIGSPALEKEPAFYVFAISSLVALCLSVTSTVIFLAILTSGFQIKDFHTNLPRKLLMGLATLCISVNSMMVSFCASHFFILRDKMSYGAFGLYASVALVPVIMTVFLISKFPHSFDLMWATFSYRPLAIPPPERSREMVLM